MSTIGDVARAAGVSVATVSRALRGLDRVSPQTRERVLKAAAELHYSASPAATRLVSGHTRGIAVVTPYFNRWYFATVISGLEKVLRDRGYHVLLCDLEGHTHDTRLSLSQGMFWKRADAVVLLNVALTSSERALLDRLQLPVVTVGNRQQGWPSVRIDDGAAMRLATEYVVGLGHERIGYAGLVPASVSHLQTPFDRRTAFLTALAAHGLSCPQDWLLDCEWTAESAAEQASRLFESSHVPTCIVAASDEIAFGIISAARRHGLVVPQDLSVIGLDDHVHSGILDLTTVRQDVVAQGQRAGALVLEAIEGKAAAGDHVIDVTLEVRGSTAPPSAHARGRRRTPQASRVS